jgi:hypothetical protein
MLVHTSRLALVSVCAVVAAAACEPSQVDPSSSDAPTPSAGDGSITGSGGGFEVPGAAEPCNGLDDNQDGAIDEGCPCAEGTTQSCFPGAVAQLNVGACLAGTQSCVVTQGGEIAASVWSECIGAVGPTAETCGDGVDSDCDGADAPCGEGGGGSGGYGAGGGASTGGCTPVTEVCDNGIDEDCDGLDEACVIDVAIQLFGDCLTASCPSSHPYPVGCDVFFSPGDDRGCVAGTPASSVVYFQAGDECNAGFISGTMYCSTQIGSPLDSSSCPINKPIPIYASDPGGCPELQN